jgi:exodeoxyribonuclease V alpha subunit
LYTGITRAAKQLTLVVPDYQVLKQAVQRRTVRAGRLPLDE